MGGWVWLSLRMKIYWSNGSLKTVFVQLESVLLTAALLQVRSCDGWLYPSRLKTRINSSWSGSTSPELYKSPTSPIPLVIYIEITTTWISTSSIRFIDHALKNFCFFSSPWPFLLHETAGVRLSCRPHLFFAVAKKLRCRIFPLRSNWRLYSMLLIPTFCSSPGTFFTPFWAQMNNKA